MASSVTVKELWIYPIKSCRGISITATKVERRGFEFDRRWMVVNEEGQFLTQRTLPRMALIHVELTAEGPRVSAPDQPPLLLQRNQTPFHSRSVVVFNDRVEAVDQGDRAAEWFSRFLGIRTRVVYMPDDTNRRVDPEYGQSGDQVSFADAYPLLILSEASVDDLNRRLPAPISFRRFRPNILVTGCDPYEEDRWKMIAIGDVSIEFVKPCERCSVTTVDPDTALRGEQPLTTLAAYRKVDGKIFFAQNAIPRRFGTIRVGDRLKIS
ncbi:MAG TPA: MOSC N-terminal beta barrel domain-containing protein [Bdellovibrionota bacterium]|nr:MOSC N-terminal beta barrel domain-containing protein [Bdellovibrionota bacterium]